MPAQYPSGKAPLRISGASRRQRGPGKGVFRSVGSLQLPPKVGGRVLGVQPGSRVAGGLVF